MGRACDVWCAHSHKDIAQTTVGIKGDTHVVNARIWVDLQTLMQ